MLGREFRGLAEFVTQTYGDSPWFFFRELAQNSRDAGAKNIWVSAARTHLGQETISFADDGRGMTFSHARRYLFRLYASDKAGDRTAAGNFGIGFWTVLRFQPSEIRLESRSGRNSWAVILDSELRPRPVACTLGASGTNISLIRPAVFPSEHEFKTLLESELCHYCQYLRRNDRQASLLPVYYQGKNLTVPMTLPPGPLSFSFRSSAVEGAVGLAIKPQVRLYARGLPVWQGAVLKQMSHLRPAVDCLAEIGSGLAPVFLLNGNHLDVTFSRDLVLENRALKKVRETAEKALRHLLQISLDQAFPRNWYQRSHDRWQAFFKRLAFSDWKWIPLAMLIVIPLEIALLSRFFPPRTIALPSAFSWKNDLQRYPGATVGLPAAEMKIPFSYAPGIGIWFKVMVADEYDLKAGFKRRKEPDLSVPLPSRPCLPENAIRMKLRIFESGRILLPCPSGYAIDPGSVTMDDKLRPAVFSSAGGESSAEVLAQSGMLNYRACPGTENAELPEAEISLMTRLPKGLEMPADLERILAESRFSNPVEKASRARALVTDLLHYDASRPTSELFQSLPQGQSWLTKVLRIGKGDCDVLNGLNTLFLRRMGIPARLVIGMIGANGGVQSGFHAWAEYFDHGWRVTDASADPKIAPVLKEGEQAQASSHDAKKTIGKHLIEAIFIFLLAASLLGIFLKARQRRQGSGVITISGPIRDFLMQLIQHALLRPEIWGHENPLWDHRILPCSEGKAISLKRAIQLLRRDELFFTNDNNPLALAMQRSGIQVLDLSQPLFAPLRNLLSGAIDVDRLYQLQLRPPAADAQEPCERMLDAINGFLLKSQKKPTPCLLAPGLRAADLLKISLPAPLRRSPFFFPQHFIAVNPQGQIFNDLSAQCRQNPALAAFKFLHHLSAESLFDAAEQSRLLKKAARFLLLVFP